jgi:hypothetical protein
MSAFPWSNYLRLQFAEFEITAGFAPQWSLGTLIHSVTEAVVPKFGWKIGCHETGLPVGESRTSLLMPCQETLCPTLVRG